MLYNITLVQCNQLKRLITKVIIEPSFTSGVTDTKDVLQRFLSQIETRTRLTYLKNTTEKEKKQLEVRKDMMLAELEAFKFAQVKDKEQ